MKGGFRLLSDALAAVDVYCGPFSLGAVERNHKLRKRGITQLNCRMKKHECAKESVYFIHSGVVTASHQDGKR